MAAPATPDAPPALDYGFEPGGLESLSRLIRLRAERDGARSFVTYLADGDRDERRLSFADLERRALTVAGALTRRGLKPGDRVLIMLPSGLEFIETFFGVLLAGMTAVPVYPPARLTRLEHYLRTLASITETASCRAMIIDDRLVPLVGKQLTFQGRLLITDVELSSANEPGVAYPAEPGSPAFLQFTSGTTSQPRGVLLLHEHLLAQLHSYTEALRLYPDEVVVSWLPLYHDLGLIGKVLAVLYAGAHLVLLSPIDFLKDPMTWLRALSRYKATHGAAPNFAYQLCVRKCTPERMSAEGLDLSSVANCGMGGEPVSWATVQAFREQFAPFGFRGEVLNPCYGLAENTLVATGHRRGEPLRTVTVSKAALQESRVEEPRGEDDRCTVVGNGRPFPRMSVRITSDDGRALGERLIGEIWVQGPSLAAGYLGDAEATAKTFVVDEDGRWLRTGDLGFQAEGDLYICGRSKDLLIVRGRNYHPQDIEQAAGRVEGVRVGNAAAFSVDKESGQGEAAVLVAEVDPRAERPAADVRRDVVEAVSAACGLSLADVILLPKGSVPKTSSGKLQRGLVKESYLRGDLAAFAPPGAVSDTLLKLRLGAASLARKVLPRRRPKAIRAGAARDATRPSADAIDPRFAQALLAVRKEQPSFKLTPALRVDGLGLDSLERVELWLQLERLYEAKVPEEQWSSKQTLGELQLLLEDSQGSAGEAREGEGADPSTDALLVRELKAPLQEPAPPWRRPITAPLLFGALASMSRAFWGWTVEGREHLNLPGGFLLAGNHVTYFDGAWLYNAATPPVRRRLTAYSWSGLPAFTRAFQAHLETIPINPQGSFRKAIRAGVQAVSGGKVLLIFPEGLRTHSGNLRTFRPGAGLVSMLSQEPIVPFRYHSAFQIFPRDRSLPRFLGWRRASEDRLVVRFGAPIHPPPLEEGRLWIQAKELVRRVRAAVEGL